MRKPTGPDTIHFYLSVLVIFAYPFSLKVSSILIGVWAIHWLWMTIRGQVKRPAWPWLALMLAVPILDIISLLYTKNLEYGLFTVVKRISLFLIPVLISTSSAWDPSHKDRFFFFAYLSAFCCALMCFFLACYQYVFYGVNAFFWNDLVAPIGFHPGYFSLFISFLVFWFMRDLRDSWSHQSSNFKLFACLSILFLAVFLILLASRLQLFLFYGTLLILVLYYIKKLDRRISVLVFLFFSVSLYIFSTTYIRERVNNISSISYKLDDPPPTFNELTIRMALAQCSWEVIRQNWFLGVGVGDSYDELEKIYYRYDYKFGYLNHQEPHNEYLQAAVGTGLVGVLLLLANFTASLYLSLKRSDLIHFLFVFFFSFSCLFESMLSQQKGIVLFALFNSLFVFVRKE